LRLAYPHVEIQPQWLEKLCRWDDAYKSYEIDIKGCKDQFKDDIPIKHERWLQSELGRLRCLQALGEFEELEGKAKTLKDMIKSSDDLEEFSSRTSLVEVQRLGANASWMLGKWSAMEDFLDGEIGSAEIKDVVLEQNLSFYSAILAIHNQDYGRATNLIAETRSALSGSISSLLSESYSRAHRAMITMQILAEMEEVIEFRQIMEKMNIDLEALKNGTNDAKPVVVNESKLSDKSIPLNVELNSKKADLIRKWRARLKWAPKDVDVYRQILVRLCIIFL
jgi:serine/threonine-protein kinase mTOR